MTWMPIHFQERHGMSITQMGWYGVSSAAWQPWRRWRLGCRLRLTRRLGPGECGKGFTIAGFVAAATQTLSVFTESTGVMIFFTVFSLCGLGLATANYWALTQSLMPGALPVAIQNTAANLAGIVAPWLTGWMIQQTGSFEAPIKAVGVWLVLGIICYVFIVRRPAAPAQS
jgi:hypothetical protein